MFHEFVTKEYPELAQTAEELDVSLDSLQSLYEMSPQTAVNTLKELIKSRAPKDQPVKVDRVAEFRERYSDLIAMALEARDSLIDAVSQFRQETGTRIIIDWDEGIERFVRLGRAPRGSVIKEERDLAELYAYLRKQKLPAEIRVFPTAEDTYETGQIQKDGTIKAGGKTYPNLSAWVNGEVYRKAVAEGKRESVIGSPWKGARIQNARGDWVTLDRMYTRMEHDTESQEATTPEQPKKRGRGRPRKER
jgi:hypothetical protein